MSTEIDNSTTITTVICPGFHPPHFTAQFLDRLGVDWGDNGLLVFPAALSSPLSLPALGEFLQANLGARHSTPLIFIGFSAGVVAAMVGAYRWQQSGGQVRGLIAIDGWGVGRVGNFPFYRISHDRFTHWSSGLLGAGDGGFYADPPVEHLDLWRFPHQTWGWWLETGLVGLKTASPMMASEAIFAILKKLGKLPN